MVTQSEQAVRHLYIHVPFCSHRCGYCSFVTTGSLPDLHGQYVAALMREHELRGGGDAYDTIYVGGGTPSLLEPAAMQQLFTWIGDLATADTEVTIECNPETIDDDRAALIGSGPITRVSLGAQTFNESLLNVLERNATPDEVRGAVARLRAAGIDNLSLDLIWGIPGQDQAAFDADLDELIDLAPDHVSAYELEFKPGTRLAYGHPAVDRVLGDDTADLYDTLVDRLETAGYRWYETANFCQPDRSSRHNLAYWHRRDHLGLGIGAVGTAGAERRTNRSSIYRYLSALSAGDAPPADVEIIGDDTAAAERIMLAARLDQPIDVDEDDPRIDAEGLQRTVRAGLIEHGDGTLQLTRRGRMLLNSVLTEILA